MSTNISSLRRRGRLAALALLPVVGFALVACEPVEPLPEPGPAAVPSILSTQNIAGPVAPIAGSSTAYVFAGPSVTVTTTSTHPRVTASASAPIGLIGGSPPQNADVGICYRSPGGPLVDPNGGNFSQHSFTTDRVSHSADATFTLAPGSYDVGLCVRNGGLNKIQNNNYAQGWVQVTI